MKKLTSKKQRLRCIYKSWLQRLKYKKHQQAKRVVFVFGSDRASVILLNNIFGKMDYTNIYDECDFSNETNPSHLYCSTLNVVKNTVRESAAPLVVCNPTIEVNNARKLLDAFPNSTAIWVYRDYNDVTKSNLVTQPPSDTLQGISLNDAAVLLWYNKNLAFFEQQLDRDPRVDLISYDAFISHPQYHLQEIYARQAIDLPLVPDYFKNLRLGRGGLAEDLEIDDDIRRMSDVLFHRLTRKQLLLYEQ